MAHHHLHNLPDETHLRGQHALTGGQTIVGIHLAHEVFHQRAGEDEPQNAGILSLTQSAPLGAGRHNDTLAPLQGDLHIAMAEVEAVLLCYQPQGRVARREQILLLRKKGAASCVDPHTGLTDQLGGHMGSLHHHIRIGTVGVNGLKNRRWHKCTTFFGVEQTFSLLDCYCNRQPEMLSRRCRKKTRRIRCILYQKFHWCVSLRKAFAHPGT